MSKYEQKWVNLLVVYINERFTTISSFGDGTNKRVNMASAVKPHVCHFCNRNFDRKYNLRRHVERVHAEEESVQEETVDDKLGNYEPVIKKRRKAEESESESSQEEDNESETKDEESSIEGEFESETEDAESSIEGESESEIEDETSSEIEDNIAYQDWVSEAVEATEEMWSEKYDKYINDGMNEDQAKEKANRKTRWAVKQHFFNSYKDFLSNHIHLKDNDTHEEILNELEEKMDRGADINKALSRVMLKHRVKFDVLFHPDEEEND